MNNDNFLHDRDVKASDVVCSHIYKIYGEDALRLIDPELIKVINFLSHTVFPSMYILINNYKGSESDIQSKYEEVFYEERGLRCNLCKSSLDRTRASEIIMDPHILGKAIDFNVYASPDDFPTRDCIGGADVIDMINSYADVLPANVRVNWKEYNWCHIDVLGMLEGDVRLKRLGIDVDSEVRKMDELFSGDASGYAPDNFDDELPSQSLKFGIESGVSIETPAIRNISFTYKGPTNVKATGAKQKIVELWDGRVPTINDSTTYVSPSPGAKGTPPAWITNQITTVSVGKFKVRVHKKLASDVTNILTEIINSGYSIKQIGGFSFRRYNNGKQNQPLSNHGTAAAIDINWSINPFKRGSKPLSKGDDMNPGHIRTTSHPVVLIFAKYGWGWGGRYGDYMHFSLANGS